MDASDVIIAVISTLAGLGGIYICILRVFPQTKFKITCRKCMPKKLSFLYCDSECCLEDSEESSGQKSKTEGSAQIVNIVAKDYAHVTVHPQPNPTGNPSIAAGMQEFQKVGSDAPDSRDSVCHTATHVEGPYAPYSHFTGPTLFGRDGASLTVNMSANPQPEDVTDSSPIVSKDSESYDTRKLSHIVKPSSDNSRVDSNQKNQDNHPTTTNSNKIIGDDNIVVQMGANSTVYI